LTLFIFLSTVAGASYLLTSRQIGVTRRTMAAPVTASALIAGDVEDCTITYDPLVVAYRAGLVTLRLTIRRDGEAVSLYHAVHVSNVP